MKKLICVIPALEKNDYSSNGDLIKMGWDNSSRMENFSGTKS